MESIGARFSQARESKGYTLEQIARDTHIAKRFLEALENEEFSAFPGEPYLLGFMRTYSSYLGLDPAETVALYHNLRLQEQPPPIDELIAKGPSIPVGRIMIIAIVVLALGTAGFFLFGTDLLTGGSANATAEPDAVPRDVAAEPEPLGEQYEMRDEIVEQRFAEGDRIVVPVQDATVPIDLTDVAEAVTLTIAGSARSVGIGEEVTLDLDDDDQSDLRIVVRSVDRVDDPPTVVMRLDRGAAAIAARAGVPVAPVGDAVAVPAVGSTLDPARQEGARLIAVFDERQEFVVEVRFEGYALFRYEADDEPRFEQYFQAGDTIRTSAREEFTFWVSNAASARLRVANRDVPLGGPGVVTAGLITWVPDPASDRLLLELVPVY